ncbi:unnamed protein product [Candida verbasci]|uniref:SHSP domain-containing protein n=1 Tax=Candida verbasci TaxID=1227364 RepID=A0A9W4XFD1_9ASCO|nr:unnamed protein product [Candida verbasci]
MFSSWFDDYDDSLWSRARKYSSRLPRDYNPRRVTENLPWYASDRDLQPLSYDSPRRSKPHSALARREGDFIDDFWRNVERGKYFVGFDENLHTTEEDDKYLVSFDRENLSVDDVSIDFNKHDNELVISVDQSEQDRFGRSTSSKYHSAMKFNKPIKVDDIKADITDHGIELKLPKEHADSEQVVQIPLQKSEKKRAET